MKNNNPTSIQDLEWAIGLNRASLRLMGAWPGDDDHQKLYLRKLYDTMIMPLMILAMLFLVFLPQMYALPLVSSDFVLVIDNVMTSCPAIISCSKLALLWLNKEVLRPVVHSMQEDWLRDKQHWQYKVMRKSAIIGKSLTTGGYFLVAISYAVFAIAPLFGLDIRLVTNITDYGWHPLIVQSYYPFNYARNQIFFEFMWLSQLFACTMIAVSLAVPDNYFGILVFHLSGQFEILGSQMENLFQPNDARDMFMRKLKVCINRHVHLINMVEAVEKSFSFIIFNQILSLYSLACCTGFRILHAFNNPSEKVSVLQIMNLFGGLIFIMMFALTDCTACEILTYHVSYLFRKIYNSKWYMFPGLPTRDLTIMMIMAEKPVRLTAGKFIYLSLSSYCSIIKTIAGYISVLLAVGG